MTELQLMLVIFGALLLCVLILIAIVLSRINRLISINPEAGYQEFTRLLQNSETSLNNGFSESRKVRYSPFSRPKFHEIKIEAG